MDRAVFRLRPAEEDSSVITDTTSIASTFYGGAADVVGRRTSPGGFASPALPTTAELLRAGQRWSEDDAEGAAPARSDDASSARVVSWLERSQPPTSPALDRSAQRSSSA